MRHFFVVAMTLLAATASVATAQGPVRATATADSTSLPPVLRAPDAMPGSVVSVAVRVPRRGPTDSASFTVRPGTKVMLYGPDSGELAWSGGESVLPLTFSVPRDEAAGMMHIAHVEVHWSDGVRWVTDVQSRVGVRRGLVLQVDTSSVLVPRGGSARVGFTIRNAGNATDTVALSFFKPARWDASAPASVVLASGDSHTGQFEVTTPGDVVYGETQVIRFAATGLGSDAAANVSFEVASEVSDDSRWVRLPATAVVGVTDAGAFNDAPFAFGLEASGPIGYGAEASLLARHSPYESSSPAFQRYLAGPSLRLQLRRGDQRVTGGDILFGGSPLHGSYTQASGFEGQARIGTVTTNVFAGRPFQLDAPARPGHLLSARTETPLANGTVGVSIADLERPYGVGALTERTQVATASFQGELRAGLSTRAEAGFMRLEDDEGRTRDGLSVDVSSRYRRNGVNVEARVRRVPGALATSGAAVDETFLSGAFDIGRGMSINGWAVRNDVDLLDGSGSTHDGAALALRWQEGMASAQVSANLNETSGGGLITGDSRRRSVALGGTAPVGPLMVEGTVELGQARTRDVAESLRHVTARLSYQAGAAWAWLGATHASGLFGSDLTRVDAGATLRAGRFEVDGHAGTYVGGGDAAGRLDAWLASTFHVDGQTALIAGIDYAPWNPTNAGIRVSFGARRAFGLPLPMPRHAVSEGTVYEDINGNLVRDAGEPVLSRVRIRRGSMLATTDEEGRFRFFEEVTVRDALRVDVTSLEGGMLVPPGTKLQPTGRVDVPIHRAASLRLELFRDVNDDGVRDSREVAAQGATIELVDETGRTRTAAADSIGTINFGALSPGTYTVRAFGAANQRTVGRTLTVQLEAGAPARVEVPVRYRPVEIRFRTPLPANDSVPTIVGMNDAPAPNLPGGAPGEPARDAASNRVHVRPSSPEPRDLAARAAVSADNDVQPAFTGARLAASQQPDGDANRAIALRQPARIDRLPLLVLFTALGLTLLLALLGWRRRRRADR